MKIIKISYVLAVLILFSQCKPGAFMSRKYTKGRYHENKDKLVVKTTQGNTTELSHPGPIETVRENLKPQKITLKETDKQKEDAIALNVPEVKTTQPNSLIKPGTMQVLTLMKKSMENGIKQAFTFKKVKRSGGDVPSGVTTGLSIGAIACGVGAIIALFLAIYFSLLVFAISPLFFACFGLGLVAVALGITTLVMGQGDLGGMEKAFSTVGIITGGVALIFGLLWYGICSLIIAAYWL